MITRRRVSKLEPAEEFNRQEALFRLRIWGHIAAVDQDVFTKFGV